MKTTTEPNNENTKKINVDGLRKRAWPKLVGLHSDKEDGEDGDASFSSETPPPAVPLSPPPRCRDEEQIGRDVARCTWHLLNNSQRSRNRTGGKRGGSSARHQNPSLLSSLAQQSSTASTSPKTRKAVRAVVRRKQRRLGDLINLVLHRGDAEDAATASSARTEEDEEEGDSESLHYYQGYHDICSIVMSAVGGGSSSAAVLGGVRSEGVLNGLDLPARILLRLSRYQLQDPMRSDFGALTAVMRSTIPPLIAHLDPEVHGILMAVEMEPFFAISWIITWFSHDVRDTDLAKRLFDAFIVGHPLLPVYLTVAMVLHPVNREEILATERDFSALHSTLSHLPRNSCNSGWKWTGGGYVSGEDTDTEDEDGGMNAGMNSRGSYMDVSFMSDDSTAYSAVSSMMWTAPPLEGETRVPFQDLIDAAISYM